MSDKLNLIDQNKLARPPKTHSIFMNINIAGLRCAQLRQGARPRLAGDSLKRKNTSIAIEEVEQGLIEYTFI